MQLDRCDYEALCDMLGLQDYLTPGDDYQDARMHDLGDLLFHMMQRINELESK